VPDFTEIRASHAVTVWEQCNIGALPTQAKPPISAAALRQRIDSPALVSGGAVLYQLYEFNYNAAQPLHFFAKALQTALQNPFFPGAQTEFGRLIGAGPSSGVSFPDYTRVANAYGIPAVRIDHIDCLQQLWTLLEAPGPALCEIVVDPAQEFEPRLKSRQLPDGTIVSPALEDMYPFLEPEELASNLLVKKT